jgi:hypothetical protein
MKENENIQELIQENSHLFWWVPQDKKKDLSLDSLVEAILNYGDSKSVKKLFDTVGIKTVADIFYKQINCLLLVSRWGSTMCLARSYL